MEFPEHFLRRHVGFPTVLMLLLAGGCRQAETEQSSSSSAIETTSNSVTSHVRMLRLLEKTARQAEETNPYLGSADLKRAERERDRMRANDPQDEVRCRTQLGFQALRYGQTERAIQELEAALQLVLAGRAPSTEEAAESLVLLTAVAWLRKAEIDNCLDSGRRETCIFPVVPEGIAISQDAGRHAMRYLEMLLKRRPGNGTARWLLNIAAMTTGQYPDGVPAEFRVPFDRYDGTAPLARFENVASEVGVDTMSLSGGLVADDFNLDGHLDLMVSDCHPRGQLRLYYGDGKGGFREVTDEVGLTGITGGLNLVQADYDNDGLPDVLVLRGAWLLAEGNYPNSLLRNCGEAGFVDVTLDVGLAVEDLVWPNAPTQTAGWADFDLDGDLDLCIGNENVPLQLFRNDGAAGFVDAAEDLGISVNRFVKGVTWGDYNDDGYPDLYVSCLDGPNLLFQNSGGTFQDVSEESGVQDPHRSFATWFWDYNNDGLLDLFVSSYASDVADLLDDYLGVSAGSGGMRLYQGEPGGRFRDVTRDVGLNRVAHPMGANFGDPDHDGFLDFYLGTGDIPYQALMPNLMFYNQRGRYFVDVTTLTGTGHLQKGHGVAFADFDEDGDQDLAVELGGAFAGDAFRNALFRNPGTGNHWIGIELTGTVSNRSAIGARIEVRITEGDERRSVFRHVNSGGTFGANPLRQQIGLGSAKQADELIIVWPNVERTQQVLKNLPADRIYRITEGQSAPASDAEAAEK